MTRKEAQEILLAHACCLFANMENKLCMLCPWNTTNKCIDTKINGEVITEAINKVKGIEFMRTIKLEDIKVTKAFLNTTPGEEKVQKYRNYYHVNGTQAKPIVVDYSNVLQDGYIQYLILKENGVEEATIIRKKKRKGIKTRDWNISKKKSSASYKDIPTTYIFGIHPKSKCTKEFVWRVPGSWGSWADNIEIGDTVVCQTKFGLSPVVVSRVEILDRPPVEMRVKRVLKKEIRRDGMVIEF